MSKDIITRNELNILRDYQSDIIALLKENLIIRDTYLNLLLGVRNLVGILNKNDIEIFKKEVMKILELGVTRWPDL